MIALYVWEIQQVMIGGNVFSSLVVIVFYRTVGQMRLPKAVTIVLIYFYNKREWEQSKKNVRRIVLGTVVVKNFHVN